MPPVPTLPPVPGRPPVPPVPAHRVDGAQARIPLGWPLTVMGAQQPVVQAASDWQTGTQVPIPVPKSTQKAFEG